MGEESVPVARRVRRPSWRDPRLGVGVLLVAGSVALGAWAVQDAAGTVQVYAARHTLPTGTALSEDAVVVLDVRVPADAYLPVDGGLPQDAVLTRPVGAGELLPAAAVGSAEDVAVRPVVVPVGGTLPSRVAPGTRVDLWATADPGAIGAEPPAPQLVAADLELADVLEDDSVLGSGASVELLVPEGDVAEVLAARAQDGELVLVPVTE